MVIYKITNTVNSKVYIGQTINTPENRWKEHCRKSRGKVSAVSSAIQKYGKECFVFEVVDSAESIDELNQKEALWIKTIGSLSPNGYNLNSGGNNYEDSEETRTKKSDARKNTRHTEETKDNISKAKLGVPQTDIAKYIQKLGKHLSNLYIDTGKGVRYDRRGNAYQAFIYVDGSIQSKYFSYSVYGECAEGLAIEYRKGLEVLATKYYNNKIKELHNG